MPTGQDVVNSIPRKGNDRAIVKARLEGKSFYEAAIIGGYSHTYARRFAKQICKRVEPTMRKALKACGLDTEGIALTLQESATAQKVVFVHPNQVARAVPDYPTRLKAAELALDVRGERKAPSQELSINVSIEDKRKEQERLASTLVGWGQAIEAESVVIEEGGQGVGTPHPAVPPVGAEGDP